MSDRRGCNFLSIPLASSHVLLACPLSGVVLSNFSILQMTSAAFLVEVMMAAMYSAGFVGLVRSDLSSFIAKVSCRRQPSSGHSGWSMLGSPHSQHRAHFHMTTVSLLLHGSLGGMYRASIPSPSVLRQANSELVALGSGAAISAPSSPCTVVPLFVIMSEPFGVPYKLL